jgi:hypothetical protein
MFLLLLLQHLSETIEAKDYEQVLSTYSHIHVYHDP